MLRKIGVNRVVFPERGWDKNGSQSDLQNIIDLIELSSDYSVVEYRRRKKWPVKPCKVNLRAKYGINVVPSAVRTAKQILPLVRMTA